MGSGAAGTADSRTHELRPNTGVGLPITGDRLDVFEVLEPIGVGGMGAVYRALDTRLERVVALKVLPPEQATDPENARRFYQEARAAAQLDHENIARVYNIGHDRGLHYIAFEYIDGTNIRQRVEAYGPLPVADVINFTLQIAGALVHAAERGVVHRDIKPSNLIVTVQGRAKLVDMGLARRFERTGTEDALTQSGMTLGTFDYISPEQARDPRDVDIRSDLYSLGCTMFHMLTGQPPFPGGTVLQKLLSHREEPAPDVRDLNPDVPPDLAAIILKLMAKEPERRYQSPEQLIRDLVTLANALGIRSIDSEGVLGPAPTPGWERHLYWGLPVALLLVVVSTLVWWGQLDRSRDDAINALGLGFGTPSGTEPSSGTTPPDLETRSNSAPLNASTIPTKTKVVPTESGGPTNGGASNRSDTDRVIVRSTEDLYALLRNAAAGTTFILADEGPYNLAAEGNSAPLVRDLTIRAAPGVRPLIRLFTRSTAASGSVPAFLHFQDNTVRLEGLTLDLGPTETGPAIRAEQARLVLRDCILRGYGRPAVLELITSEPNRGRSGRPAEPAFLERTHFEGGRVAILGKGPIDLGLRDCTFATSEPVVWIDNEDSSTPGRAYIWMNQVSVLSSTDPIFRFDGTEVRVQANSSVFAASQVETPATLVAIDDPARLDWSGRENLYSRVGTYLIPTQALSDSEGVLDFERWSQGPHQPRELGSASTPESVWNVDDPRRAIGQGTSISDAFRLSSDLPLISRVGATQSAQGPIAPPAAPSRLTQANSTAPSANGSATSVRPETKPAPSPAASSAPTPVETADRGSDPMPFPVDNTPFEPMLMPPVTIDPSDDMPIELEPTPAPEPRTPPSRPSETMEEPAGASVASPGTSPNGNAGNSTVEDTEPGSLNLIRSSSQFLDQLRLLGPRGGVLRLAHDAELSLPTCPIQGTGLFEVVAEPGARRPRIEFHPDVSSLDMTSDWPVLFRVQSGSLKLQGVDVFLRQSQAPASGRWSAFGVHAGASLELERSTVTIEGAKRSAVVRVQALEREAGAGIAESGAASIRFLNSFLRAGNDLVEVSAGRKIDLALNNSLVITGGALIHAHGLPPGLEHVALKADLRQVTALMGGGLLWLESAPGEPDLPSADLVVRESVLSTQPTGTALLRIDGQHEIEELADLIHWEGRKVAYHRLEFYRRDQSALPGELPLLADRSQWQLLVGRQDESPFHGDVLFVDPPSPQSTPWEVQRSRLTLDPESPVAYTSPDLNRIPSAPSDSSGKPRDGAASEPGEPGLESLRNLLPGFRLN